MPSDAAQTGAPPRTQVFWLVATMFLGTVFLGVKVIEYTDKFTHHLVPGLNFHFHDPSPPADGADLLFAVFRD